MCDAAGLPAYEVSNHARPGAESRHNLIYWRDGDYVGVGPGAHGRLTLDGKRHATAGWRMPGRWITAAEAGNGDETSETLSPQDHVGEYIMMGLRINEGVDVRRIDALVPGALPASRIAELETLNLVCTQSDRLRTTPQGRMVLNAILKDLLP